MDIKKLIAVATGEIAHTNNGLCPDMVAGYDSRDPDCLACQIIMEAEREKQEPVAWLDKSTEERPGDTVWLPGDLKGMDTSWLVPLYAAQPVTAPVRLTDKQIAESHANEIMNCLQDPCDKSESVMPMPHDVNRFVRAIETAVLRANGFNIDHPEHALELVGLRGCNSQHGGARKPEPCIYRMRTTDPGCTGCADRNEDQAAEAGDSNKGEQQ